MLTAKKNKKIKGPMSNKTMLKIISITFYLALSNSANSKKRDYQRYIRNIRTY